MNQSPILIVEDEPDGQELVSRMLAVVGIPIDIAVDGEEAWTMLQRKQYGLAIIDLALPGMDGFDLLKQIRAAAGLADLLCVAITAYHTPELRQRAIASGFNAYFAKPLDRTLFLDALDNLMSGR